MEGDEGTRRYKWFRPRQAARGGVPSTTASSGHYPTVSLFNNSTGPHVLVVRDYQVQSTLSSLVVVGYNQGRLAGTNYAAQALFPGDALPAGLVDYQSAGAKLTGDYQFQVGVWGYPFWVHDFPFAVLPPGWALFFQGQTTQAALTCGILWEAVSTDQLEFFWS